MLKTKPFWLVVFLTAFMLQLWMLSCEKPEPKIVYEPTWESLKQHKLATWFDDAKFGIFIHWGVYSVPAFASEWYPHHMYIEGSEIYNYHVETYGHPSEFGYKDFIPMFKAENWDPDAWAELFHKAGAKYVVPTAEHHDGFAMWASDLTEWDAMDMGPKRDLIAELEGPVRSRGMKYAPSYHRAHSWYYYTCKDDYDTCDPKYKGLYSTPHEDGPATEEWLIDWKNRWEEIRDRFKPDFLWFDFGWGQTEFHPYAKQLIADYYNIAQEWGKEVAVVNKTIRRPPMIPKDVGDFIELDHMRMDSVSTRKWECPTYMGGGSWAYNKAAKPEDYKKAEELVEMLIDVVSKNGNLLLDVGPKADGTIPDIQKDRLLKIGAWMDVNSKAIYSTRPWTTFGEGPANIEEGAKYGDELEYTSEDIRFTTKGSTLYAIVMDWPEESVLIKSLKNVSDDKIKSVMLLGSDAPLEWQQTANGLTVSMPDQKPCEYAYTLKIDFQGEIPEAS
jgi:alpha-L-fucosidase